MVLRKIFRPKRVEDGSWRKLRNDKPDGLYSSPNIVRMINSRRMRWAGHIARMRKDRGIYRDLVGRPEGKRSLGRPRRRWDEELYNVDASPNTFYGDQVNEHQMDGECGTQCKDDKCIQNFGREA
jgi:hypothetical protein